MLQAGCFCLGTCSVLSIGYYSRQCLALLRCVRSVCLHHTSNNYTNYYAVHVNTCTLYYTTYSYLESLARAPRVS